MFRQVFNALKSVTATVERRAGEANSLRVNQDMAPASTIARCTTRACKESWRMQSSLKVMFPCKQNTLFVPPRNVAVTTHLQLIAFQLLPVRLDVFSPS